MNKAEINSRAGEVINLFKERFINSDGLLARNYPVTNRTIFDNFDDLAPFFLYFGEKEFILSQIRRIRALKKDICSLCASDGVLISRNLDEWPGGLYALWQETKDDDVLSLLTESLDFIAKNLLRDGFLSAAYLTAALRVTTVYFAVFIIIQIIIAYFSA